MNYTEKMYFNFKLKTFPQVNWIASFRNKIYRKKKRDEKKDWKRWKGIYTEWVRYASSKESKRKEENFNTNVKSESKFQRD